MSEFHSKLDSNRPQSGRI